MRKRMKARPLDRPRRRERGPRRSPPPPSGGSSSAAWHSMTRSGGKRFRRCCSGSGGATRRPGSEAELMGACLVAAIDHGALSPSALVARTIASTEGIANERPCRRYLVVRRAARRRRQSRHADRLRRASHRQTLMTRGDATFVAERSAGRRAAGIGHRWHHEDLRPSDCLKSPPPCRMAATPRR